MERFIFNLKIVDSSKNMNCPFLWTFNPPKKIDTPFISNYFF